MNIQDLLSPAGVSCACGHTHHAFLKEAIIRRGAVRETGAVAARLSGSASPRAFVLADKNTWKAAGEAVCASLREAGVACSVYVLQEDRPEPEERVLGSFMMHYDNDCSVIVGVGSGVVNDNGKILAGMAKLPYVIVGTAPSMDGYASGTSSMARDGAKISLNSKCPDAVIGDLDILAAAPMRLIQAGVGDMLAKYISICEWRIGRVVCGEYYCETVASMVREALHRCVSQTEGIARRDPDAIAAVMEGMCLSGIAANYAGITRPVSGSEHYFSHLWDMRFLALGAPCDLHGIQCGVGTVLALRAYEEVRKLRPSREKALQYVRSFSFEDWKGSLRELLGSGAETLIESDCRERRYDLELHAARLERILDGWDEILRIIDEELPTADEARKVLRSIGAPSEPEEIGMSADLVRRCFPATKDIRDKYVLSRMLWDIGELEGVTERVFG